MRAFKKIKDKVKYLLHGYPVTRDDDKMLYIAYLTKYHGLGAMLTEDNYNVVVNVIKEGPMPESIRRVRQKIQESGQYPGTKRGVRSDRETDIRKNINIMEV